MSTNWPYPTYALVGHRGDDGGRYSPNQVKEMKQRALAMRLAGDIVQVWTTTSNGALFVYDAKATCRIAEYIVRARAALTQLEDNPLPESKNLGVKSR